MKEKEERRQEKERQKQEKERQRLEKEETRRAKRKQRTVEKRGVHKEQVQKKTQKDVAQNSSATRVVQMLQQMTLSDDVLSDGDETICPKCGAVFGDEKDTSQLWVCCDGCDVWFDLKCTPLSKDSIPDIYYCETCLEVS